MSLAGLPPLREVVARHGIAARRGLGQNFLFDLNLTGKVARAAGPLDGIEVVEIGPGPGGLTRALLAAGAARVIAVERDSRCLPALADIAAAAPGRLEVIEADALTLDWSAFAGAAPRRIVANLPYNIGTALLLRWLTLDPWPPWYESMTLMFQREVAERIVAGPERPGEYGRLAVLARWRSEPSILFDVPPSAFTPAPKVVSSVVRLVPRQAPLPCPLPALERVTAHAFGQRRKMLRQSLKGLGDAQGLIAAAGLDPTARAETVPVAGFVALANALAAPARLQPGERRAD